jgi:hypothetical protein
LPRRQDPFHVCRCRLSSPRRSQPAPDARPLKARPGLTVGELGERFEFSRLAVMKHLRIPEPVGNMVELTMTHEGFASETQTYQKIRTGWTPIFDGLKSLLETGKAPDFPPM